MTIDQLSKVFLCCRSRCCASFCTLTVRQIKNRHSPFHMLLTLQQFANCEGAMPAAALMANALERLPEYFVKFAFRYVLETLQVANKWNDGKTGNLSVPSENRKHVKVLPHCSIWLGRICRKPKKKIFLLPRARKNVFIHKTIAWRRESNAECNWQNLKPIYSGVGHLFIKTAYE